MAAPLYELRVAGDLSESVLQALADEGVAEQEVRTVLTGRFEDQAALYRLLFRLRSLGLEVVEVRRIAVESGSERGAAGEGGTAV